MGYVLELTHSSLFWGIFEGFLLNLAVAWIVFDTVLVRSDGKVAFSGIGN
jgi:hypothetical protein